MVKKIKYILISIILGTIIFCAGRVNLVASTETSTEVSEVEQFKITVNEAYNYYFIYDRSEMLHTDDFELIVAEGSIDDKMSFSVYYKPYSDTYSNTLIIEYADGTTTEYTAESGSELYNYSYDLSEKITINVRSSSDKTNKFSYEIKYYTLTELVESGKAQVGLAKHTFPKSTMINNTLLQKGYLAVVIVVGIFIAGILIIIIAVMIATKNVNIRREKRPTTVYYTPRNNNYNDNDNVIINDSNEESSEQTIIDVKSEEPLEETSEEDELKRLYTLHAKKEITDEELEILLRKYRGKRDDD